MAGLFIAVVGASGVGKDAILRRVKSRLQEHDSFYFPTRYITREPGHAGEEYISISNNDFVQKVRDDRFSLWWCAHDLHYGLPDDVYDALRQNRTVVANLSRRSVREARERFPNFQVIEVVASPEICRKRLLLRERKSEAEIMVLQLREIMPDWADELKVYRVNNEGALEVAVTGLLSLVLRLAGQTSIGARSNNSTASELLKLRDISDVL